MSSQHAKGERNANFVQSLERGLTVMEELTRESRALTISDLSKRTSLPKPTTRRVLHTLRELGYVDQVGTRFSLATGALRLGYSLIASVPLREIAIPYMVSLVDQVRESCVLSLLDGLDVIEVANVPFDRSSPVALALRSRFPAHVTPAGRLLIASLPVEERSSLLDRLEPLKGYTTRTIRNRSRLEQALDEAAERGWALVDEEFEEGIRSIAAPIRDGNDRVVAAIGVWSYSSKVSVQRFRNEILPHVRETASLVTSRLISGR